MSGNNKKTDKSPANKAKLERKQAEIRAKKEADVNKTYVGRGTKTFQKERSKKISEEGKKIVQKVKKEVGEFHKNQQLKASIEQKKLNSNAKPFYPSDK